MIRSIPYLLTCVWWYFVTVATARSAINILSNVGVGTNIILVNLSSEFSAPTSPFGPGEYPGDFLLFKMMLGQKLVIAVQYGLQKDGGIIEQ